MTAMTMVVVVVWAKQSGNVLAGNARRILAPMINFVRYVRPDQANLPSHQWDFLNNGQIFVSNDRSILSNERKYSWATKQNMFTEIQLLSDMFAQISQSWPPTNNLFSTENSFLQGWTKILRWPHRGEIYVRFVEVNLTQIIFVNCTKLRTRKETKQKYVHGDQKEIFFPSESKIF